MEKNICIGRICKAKAGRGKGRYFMICGIVNETYVLLTDGSSRKIAKPKLKKTRHVVCRPYVAEEIAKQIAAGQTPTDAEIRTQLDRIAAIEKQ